MYASLQLKKIIGKCRSWLKESPGRAILLTAGLGLFLTLAVFTIIQFQCGVVCHNGALTVPDCIRYPLSWKLSTLYEFMQWLSCKTCWLMHRHSPWILFTSAATAPSLILLWYWRDKHKRSDIRNEETKLFQAHCLELTKRATDFDNPPLQISSVTSLEDYLTGNILPAELKENNPFSKSTFQLFTQLMVEVESIKPLTGDKYKLLENTLKKQIISALSTETEALRNVSLTGSNLSNQDLSSLDLSSFKLNQSDFIDTTLIGTSFRQAKIWSSRFIGAKLINTDFSNADVSTSDFTNADIQGANFSNASLQEAIFIKAKNISEAKFNNARYSVGTKFPEDFSPREHSLILVNRITGRTWYMADPYIIISTPFSDKNDLDDWKPVGCNYQIEPDDEHGLKVLKLTNTSPGHGHIVKIIDDMVEINDLVDISVEFKCKADAIGQIFIGDTNRKGGYGVDRQQGNENWKKLHIQLKREYDNFRFGVWLYSNTGKGYKEEDFVMYRNLKIEIYKPV